MNNTLDKKEELNELSLFAAPLYKINKPEFLTVTRKVAKKFIAKRKKEVELDPSYPVYMTEAVNYDPEMLDFANYVAQIAWSILSAQGYAMNSFNTYFTSMWCQEHHNLSLMERHIHGDGNVITGFYFLDCPKDSSRVIFYDPRDSKVITSLPQEKNESITHASNMINFVPEEGDLFFSNAYLPHSFTKNLSKKPMRFIHFNVAVEPSQQTQNFCKKPQAEII